MSRDWKLFRLDMIEAAEKIVRHTSGLDRGAFVGNELVYDAVVRNLEIIGEAAKAVPREVMSRYRAVDWKKIAGLRDVLAHAYFAIDEDILWEVVSVKVPELLKVLREMEKE